VNLACERGRRIKRLNAQVPRIEGRADRMASKSRAVRFFEEVKGPSLRSG